MQAHRIYVLALASITLPSLLLLFLEHKYQIHQKTEGIITSLGLWKWESRSQNVTETLSTFSSENLHTTTERYRDPSWKKIVYFCGHKFLGDWDGFVASRSELHLASAGCSETRCSFSGKVKDVETADAVVFYSNCFSMNGLPRKRSPHQRYVWMNWESPLNVAKSSMRSGFYNWTLTYHRQSDVLAPYALFVPLKLKELPVRAPVLSAKDDTLLEYSEALRNGSKVTDYRLENWTISLDRPKLVAWMVSHCRTQSRREKYVQLLQQHIEVDVYGRCGPLRCKKSADMSCYVNVLARNYKFYLSFENSLCDDYLTEKVYNAYIYGIVPVVYGGANYSQLLPPNSYIDATYLAPEELAKELKRIAASPEEYARYHLWRAFWTVIRRWPMCELCHKLHNDHTNKTVESLNKWWGNLGKCRPPTFLRKEDEKKEE